MSQQSIDQLVLLLSTDWFFAHWPLVDLEVSVEGQKNFQLKCREISSQILSEAKINGSNSFYSTDFSDKRVSETARLFCQALESIESSNFCDNYLSLSNEQKQQLSTLASLSAYADSQNIKSAKPKLSDQLTHLISKTYQSLDTENIDFKNLCFSSVSDWDCYIQEVMRELPTALADFAFVESQALKMQRFWKLLRASATNTELSEISSWYQKKFKALTGQKLNLPMLK